MYPLPSSLKVIPRQEHRFSQVPRKESVTFRPRWALSWIEAREDLSLLAAELERSSQAYLYFHQAPELRTWELLEIGIPKSRQTFLVERELLDRGTPRGASYPHSTGKELPQFSHKELGLCLKDVLRNTHGYYTLFNVVELCSPILDLHISPYRITDLRLKVSRQLPHMRTLGFFELAEQLLGVCLPERRHVPGGSSHILELSHLQYAGLCSELLYHLSRYLEIGRHTILSHAKPNLRLLLR